MKDSRQKNIEELDREINQCKNNLNINESFILAQLTKYKTPQKEDPLIRTQTQNLSTNNQSNANCFTASNIKPNYNISAQKRNVGVEQAVSANEIMSYIASIKKLQGTLQEKSYIMQVDCQKQRLNYQNKIEKLTREIEVLSYDLQKSNRDLIEKDKTINMLQNQMKLVQAQSDKLKQFINDYKKENLQLKQENKKYKADNKVIMNHIDMLTKDKQACEQKKKSLEERELRVMKSLYQDTLSNIQFRQAQKVNQTMNNLTNKIKLDDAVDRNGELKSLIRRLNEEIKVLKAEKALMQEQIKEKAQNLQSQKKIVQLSEQTNKRLQEVIEKMGLKILTLQQTNQSLRESLRKANDGSDVVDEYFSPARSKIGQFYYKR